MADGVPGPDSRVERGLTYPLGGAPEVGQAVEVAPGVLRPGVLYRADALHRLTRAGRRMDNAIHEPGRAPAAT